MQKLRIKSKRDWFIAFIIAFLFIYLIALKFQVRISELLWPLTPDKLSILNQPDGQGVFAAAVLAMTALSIGVMIYKKVKGKYLVLALAGGIVIAGAAIGAYCYQCQSIVNIPSESKPESVDVQYFGRDGGFVNYQPDEETKARIVDKVLTLQPLPKEEAKAEREAAKQRIENTADSRGGWTSVAVWYPKEDGYSYLISIDIEDHVIRADRGHSLNSTVFYRDNGLLELIEGLKSSEQLENNR
ncbi:MAG TPA: hypothetical protein PKA19_07000 [Bacillota bacterium]|nr:hypothetical protein [Bacillota bacterium]